MERNEKQRLTDMAAAFKAVRARMLGGLGSQFICVQLSELRIPGVNDALNLVRRALGRISTFTDALRVCNRGESLAEAMRITFDNPRTLRIEWLSQLIRDIEARITEINNEETAA